MPKDQHAQSRKKIYADELRFIQMYPNRTLKLDFLCQKFSEYQFRTFVKKTFFDKFNVKNNLFLKSCPIFDKLSFIGGIFK